MPDTLLKANVSYSSYKWYYIAVFVVNYGISNTVVLEIP